MKHHADQTDEFRFPVGELSVINLARYTIVLRVVLQL